MAIAQKRKLSSSADGKGIKVAATATAGTAIHTAVAGTTAGTYDEVWLYAYNSDTVDQVLTIEFGGVAAPDDNIVQTLSPQAGAILIIPGWCIQNSLVVRAFGSAANKIVVFGFVNAITD